MAFWKKSEDPWDMDPHQRRPAIREEDAKQDPDAGSLLDDLRTWNEERKVKKARRDAPPAPMACPWCGQEMEAGYLYTGRDMIYWSRQKPGVLGPLMDSDRLWVDHEGGFLAHYKTAWHCTACRKMVLDTTQVRPRNEESEWDEGAWSRGPKENNGEEET